MRLTKPTIHLNGTSAERLYNDLDEARRAARDLLRALEDCAPNARDYYPQGADAFSRARMEHQVRIEAVRQIQYELNELHEHVADSV